MGKSRKRVKNGRFNYAVVAAKRDEGKLAVIEEERERVCDERDEDYVCPSEKEEEEESISDCECDELVVCTHCLKLAECSGCVCAVDGSICLPCSEMQGCPEECGCQSCAKVGGEVTSWFQAMAKGQKVCSLVCSDTFRVMLKVLSLCLHMYIDVYSVYYII